MDRLSRKESKSFSNVIIQLLHEQDRWRWLEKQRQGQSAEMDDGQGEQNTARQNAGGKWGAQEKSAALGC